MDKSQIEIIEDKDKLFYHIGVHVFAPSYNYDDIPPHAFTPIGQELSVNWEKYCKTGENCLLIKTPTYPSGKTSQTHGVGHFISKEIKEVENLDVKHSPSANNRAHSLIFGIPPSKPKPPYNEMRKRLKRLFHSWDIVPEFIPQEKK